MSVNQDEIVYGTGECSEFLPDFSLARKGNDRVILYRGCPVAEWLRETEPQFRMLPFDTDHNPELMTSSSILLELHKLALEDGYEGHSGWEFAQWLNDLLIEWLELAQPEDPARHQNISGFLRESSMGQEVQEILMTLAAHWRAEGEYWCGDPADARSQHCADELYMVLGLDPRSSYHADESLLDKYGIALHYPPDRVDPFVANQNFQTEVAQEMAEDFVEEISNPRNKRPLDIAIREKIGWGFEYGYTAGFKAGVDMQHPAKPKFVVRKKTRND